MEGPILNRIVHRKDDVTAHAVLEIPTHHPRGGERPYRRYAREALSDMREFRAKQLATTALIWGERIRQWDISDHAVTLRYEVHRC